jgi:predicted phosphodiesterase
MLRVCAAAIISTLLFASTAEARITKGPWVTEDGSSSAVVRIEVDPPAAVTLSIDGAGTHKVIEHASAGVHAIALDQLAPATKYTYVTKSGGVERAASFTTAPADDATAPFTFLVFGDNRTDDTAHASVVRAMAPTASDFVIHTGDFVENGASAAQWQNFFDIEAPLLSTRLLAPAVGNHELVDGSGVNYVKYFGPANATSGTKPEHLNHTFRWENTRFILVNGLSNWKSGVERDWLERALDDADIEKGILWRVVVVHHGPYSSGPHGGNPRFNDARLVPLFKQHKVDIVFSGHDHIYERGLGGGLPFIVTGGGGAPVYRVKKRIPESRHAEAVRHFIEAEVTAKTMTLTAVRADGSHIERCALSKEQAGWFCGGQLEQEPVILEDGGIADLGEPEKTPPPAKSRCSCSEIGAAPEWSGTIPLGGALLLPVIAYARRRRR